eukprot:CAMPEP_0173238816 /NCGR_PEP_ID=MMETSP1142-20121109/12853_1 /TAXON_ID=483371 /ORGANISM="non described non described, Strain CCMP2298" /LENGTH=56 /DNA_ID=CAMNT_0014169733 /DNA_START=504 /DNA_END=674 /DNA_ORIENTATION=-
MALLCAMVADTESRSSLLEHMTEEIMAASPKDRTYCTSPNGREVSIVSAEKLRIAG